MSQFYTWKSLMVVIGTCLLIGLACLINGNPGAASAFFVMSVVETVFWVGVMAIQNVARKFLI